MVTKANRQRAKRKKPEHQADDAYIPMSLKKAETPKDVSDYLEMRSGELRKLRPADPLGDLCGEPWHPVAIYLTAAAIAFAGGLGLGWAVWA